eukprot:11221114-Karenia_brevis.AAC.1
MCNGCWEALNDVDLTVTAEKPLHEKKAADMHFWQKPSVATWNSSCLTPMPLIRKVETEKEFQNADGEFPHIRNDIDSLKFLDKMLHELAGKMCVNDAQLHGLVLKRLLPCQWIDEDNPEDIIPACRGEPVILSIAQ